MFFRRVRTLADQFLASDYIETRLLEQLDRLSPPGGFSWRCLVRFAGVGDLV